MTQSSEVQLFISVSVAQYSVSTDGLTVIEFVLSFVLQRIVPLPEALMVALSLAKINTSTPASTGSGIGTLLTVANKNVEIQPVTLSNVVTS